MLLIGAGKVRGATQSLFGGSKAPDFSYRRDFSAVKAAPLTGPYLRHREYADADEAYVIDELRRLFVSDQTCPGAGRRDRDHQDLHWGHTTGYLRGKLDIDALDHLDPDLRKGLFESPDTYEVICRPNQLYDDEPLIAINRLSIKISYPHPVPNRYAKNGTAHEIDLLLSEGIPGGGEPDGRGFFFRDARHLLMANEMAPGRKSKAGFALNPFHGREIMVWSRIFKSSVDKLYARPQTTLSWAGKHYFSAGPYALGDGLVKYGLKPRQTPSLAVEEAPAVENPAKHHRDWFQGMMEPISFDLCLQVAVADAIPEPGVGDPPKDVMATEYTDLAWDETIAPFERVGTLTLCNEVIDQQDGWYAMPMNAWNTLEDMRPLGQLFRARKAVHEAHRAARLKISFEDEAAICDWPSPFDRED